MVWVALILFGCVVYFAYSVLRTAWLIHKHRKSRKNSD